MKKFTLFLSALLITMVSMATPLGEGYSKVTNITTLSAGDKVVLYCDDAELGVTGWDGNKTATVAATGWVEYIVEAADGGVLLKDADKYIALTAKNAFYYNETGSVCKVNATENCDLFEVRAVSISASISIFSLMMSHVRRTTSFILPTAL